MDKHIIQTYLETIIGDSAADAELLSYTMKTVSSALQ